MTRRFPQDLVTNQLPNHMREFRKQLRAFSRVPHSDSILTGKLLEKVYASSIGGIATGDNSFIDVRKGDTGWQLKSTIQTTGDIVLRRATIQDQAEKIVASKTSETAREDLGVELLQDCNNNITNAMSKHDVERVGYCHAKFFEGNSVEVMEAVFANTRLIFNPDNFYFEWSDIFYGQEPRTGMPSLLVIRTTTDQPWFSWCGQGQNHFRVLRERDWLTERCDSISRYGFSIHPSGTRLTLNSFETAVADAAELQGTRHTG